MTLEGVRAFLCTNICVCYTAQPLLLLLLWCCQVKLLTDVGPGWMKFWCLKLMWTWCCFGIGIPPKTRIIAENSLFVCVCARARVCVCVRVCSKHEAFKGPSKKLFECVFLLWHLYYAHMCKLSWRGILPRLVIMSNMYEHLPLNQNRTLALCREKTISHEYITET